MQFIVLMKLAIKKITTQQRALNLSNRELASEIGMTQRGFSVMMSRRTTHFQTVARLAEALRLKERSLIEFNQETSQQESAPSSSSKGK